MVVHAGKFLSLKIWRNFNDYPEEGVKPQAIGGRKGLPLIGNAKGEEIVFARSERKWSLA